MPESLPGAEPPTQRDTPAGTPDPLPVSMASLDRGLFMSTVCPQSRVCLCTHHPGLHSFPESLVSHRPGSVQVTQQIGSGAERSKKQPGVGPGLEHQKRG